MYGLSCSAWDAAAVARILTLKRRHIDKGLIIVVAHFQQLAPFLDLSSEELNQAILSSWPGPVTWILPAKKQVPSWITGKSSDIAVRITAHPFLRDLCRVTGSLVSTSANPTGAQAAKTCQRVRSYFGTQLNYIVPGRCGPYSQPTEIRHAATGEILRQRG